MPSSPTEKINRMLSLVREIKRRPTQKPESLYAKLGCSRSQFFEDRQFLRSIGFEFQYDRNLTKYVISRDPHRPESPLTPAETYALLIASSVNAKALRAARKLLMI
jgi:predicted DNA-binding transcriptional regulator YafY